jgi:hypothetical protein
VGYPTDDNIHVSKPQRCANHRYSPDVGIFSRVRDCYRVFCPTGNSKSLIRESQSIMDSEQAQPVTAGFKPQNENPPGVNQRPHLSSSGCTQRYGVISRVSISLGAAGDAHGAMSSISKRLVNLIRRIFRFLAFEMSCAASITLSSRSASVAINGTYSPVTSFA